MKQDSPDETEKGESTRRDPDPPSLLEETPHMERATGLLTLAFVYEGDMIRATSTFKEEDVRRELDDAGIHWDASRKEVQISYAVELPLDEPLLERLRWLKEMGMCANYAIKDDAFSTDGERSNQ